MTPFHRTAIPAAGPGWADGATLAGIVLLHAAVLAALRAPAPVRPAEPVREVAVTLLPAAPVPAPVPAVLPAPAPRPETPPAPPPSLPSPPKPRAPKPVKVPKPAPRPVPKPVESAAPEPAPAPNPTPAESAPPQPAPAPSAAPTPAAPPAAAPAAPVPAADAPPATPRTLRAGVRYLEPPQPEYPPLSRRMGEQGRTVLRVLIDAQGRPERIEIKRSSGSARLDDAARRAVERALFRPHVEDGRPVAVYALVPIAFQLDR